MKQLLILLSLTFLTSCSKDDIECKCDLKVTIDGTGYYYVSGVSTDCNGNYVRPSSIPQDHFIIGLVNCD